VIFNTRLEGADKSHFLYSNNDHNCIGQFYSFFPESVIVRITPLSGIYTVDRKKEINNGGAD